MHQPPPKKIRDPESPWRGKWVTFLILAIILVLIALGIVLYVRH